MSRSSGYAWEKEVEDALMPIGGAKRSDPLHARTRRQPASGAMESAKGDVVTQFSFLETFGQFMVECKDHKARTGDGKSISIKKEWLDKVRVEADVNLMHPALAFKLKQPVGGDRTPLFPGDRGNPMNTKWVAVPLGTFVLLLEHIRDLVEGPPTTKESPKAVPSSVGADCRACRRALDKATETVRRTMGG